MRRSLVGPKPSWPGLSRPSTNLFLRGSKNVDARDIQREDALRASARHDEKPPNALGNAYYTVWNP